MDWIAPWIKAGLENQAHAATTENAIGYLYEIARGHARRYQLALRISDEEMVDDLIDDFFAEGKYLQCRLESRAQFAAFLWRSVKHAYLNVVAHEQVKQRSEPGKVAERTMGPPSKLPDELAEEQELWEHLFEAVHRARLTEHDLVILRMRFVENATLEAIARKMGGNRHGIARHLLRLLQRLRPYLKGHI